MYLCSELTELSTFSVVVVVVVVDDDDDDDNNDKKLYPL